MIAQAQHLAMARVIIGRLPDALREVFVLYELEELDGEAIGEMLAIPLGTVWSRLHAARRRFSTTMQRHLSRPEAP